MQVLRHGQRDRSPKQFPDLALAEPASLPDQPERDVSRLSDHAICIHFADGHPIVTRELR